MKQLFSLAWKYIRRQKQRTLLTFLCIVLAVFIFNLLAAGVTVVRNVSLQNLIKEEGDWEVMPDGLTKACEEELGISQQEARRQIVQHPVVEKYSLTDGYYVGTSLRNDWFDPDLEYGYFEISENGGEPSPIQALYTVSREGDADMSGSRYTGNDVDYVTGPEDRNLIFLPYSYQEKGWKTGDSFTLTLTPCAGKLTDDCPQIQALYDKYAAEVSANPDKTLFFKEDSMKSSILEWPRLSAAAKEFGFGNIRFSEVRRGTPYTFTMTVGGFTRLESALDQKSDRSAHGTLMLYHSVNTDLDFEEGLIRPNEEFLGTNPALATVRADHNGYVQLRIKDRLGFDESLELLYKDLGLPENDRDFRLHPQSAGSMYHTDLLALEFRGADAIASWIIPSEGSRTNRLPVTVALLIAAFLLWLLMRAVIDNAFEISVQERRAQFATLRIMGASRRQVGVLVCFEAMFYTLAAVPIGMLAAHLCARLAAHRLVLLGFGSEYRPLGFLLLIFTLLAVSGVFISAYSSSMWAARAYAPLEATKKAELKSTKPKNIFTRDLFGSDPETRMQKKLAKQQARFEGKLRTPRSVKLNRTRSGFLRHYTVRNIRRTRRRFILSVFTMAIGTLMFFAGGAMGVFLLFNAGEILADNSVKTDFKVYFSGDDAMTQIENAEKLFADDPHIASLSYYNQTIVQISKSDEEIAALRQQDTVAADYFESYPAVKRQVGGNGAVTQLAGENAQTEEPVFVKVAEITVKFLAKSEYDAVFAPYLGISYEDLVQMGCAVFRPSAKDYTESSGQLYDSIALLSAGNPGFAQIRIGATVRLNPADALRLHPQSKDGISRDAETRLYVPYEAAAAAGLWQNNGYSKQIGFGILLTDTEGYLPVREKVESLRSNLSETYCFVTDNFFAATGLKMYVRLIVTICLIAWLAVWMTGILTMVNTVNTSVLNRADELMMLRTVGMTKRSVRKTVLGESLIYTGTSTLIGCVIGLAAALKMATELDLSGNYMMKALAAMLIMLGLTVVLNLLVASVAATPGLRSLNARMEEGALMQ